ncbi:uncharacterized protein LODBEIA_P52710 [Lodderomyces beijingensis]|uniref:DH domain-containing protein n=1 Tax=Lodderomyces beijingensis TaxID=1775926 RepID=A0ABP0ZUN0_9ASCO
MNTVISQVENGDSSYCYRKEIIVHDEETLDDKDTVLPVDIDPSCPTWLNFTDIGTTNNSTPSPNSNREAHFAPSDSGHTQLYQNHRGLPTIQRNNITTREEKHQRPRPHPLNLGNNLHHQANEMIAIPPVVERSQQRNNEPKFASSQTLSSGAPTTSRNFKTSSRISPEALPHHLIRDVKFQYQQHVIEFLNYVIGKYKEWEDYIEASSLFWNDSYEGGLVLHNLAKISEGYRKMILSVLRALSVHAGIALNPINSHKSQKELDSDLINCNIFQFVYNCSIEEINIGDLINTSLFSNEFKFNLMSYYYKLDFLLSKQVRDAKWLAIPMEIWYKLPSYIKLTRDHLNEMAHRRNCQDLETCLVKLNSITSKLPQIDEMKKRSPVSDWKDLEKINLQLEAKFPEYCHFKNFDYSKLYNAQQLADFKGNPLSSSTDNDITHSKYRVKQLGKVTTTSARLGRRKTSSSAAAAAAGSSTSSSVSRATSLKSSFSNMVKKHISSNDTDKHTQQTKLKISEPLSVRKEDSRESVKTHGAAQDNDKSSSANKQKTMTEQMKSVLQQQESLDNNKGHPPPRQQSLRDQRGHPLKPTGKVPDLPLPSKTKDVLALSTSTSISTSKSTSTSTSVSTSTTSIPLRKSNENRHPKAGPSLSTHKPITLVAPHLHSNKQVDTSHLEHQLMCLRQLREKLFNLGPQLIEFLNLQLSYCKLWQKFLEDEEKRTQDEQNGVISDLDQLLKTLEMEASRDESRKTLDPRAGAFSSPPAPPPPPPQPPKSQVGSKKLKQNPYIRSIYQSFNEKLCDQIEFTKSTIIVHVADRLIIPIDECLKLCQQGKGDRQTLDKFMELIVKQYNKLYCDWLEGMIGPKSIKEYQALCERIESLQRESGVQNGTTAAKIGGGDDIIAYFQQLTKLKNLVSG